jgi:anti-sigma factor RsiW
VDCQNIQRLLDPYLDGELDSVASESVAGHLRNCGECATIHQHHRELSQAARELRYSAPPALTSLVRSSIRNDFEIRRTRALRIWRTVAMAACLLLAVTLIGPMLLHRSATTTTTGAFDLTDQVIATHVRSLMAEHLLDVATSDQHTVKPWFAGKVDFSPDVRDFADRGYTLQGGRLEYLNRRPVAAIVYRHDKHVINAFTWPAEGDQAAAARSDSRQGYHVLTWREGPMMWCVVSDAGERTLRGLHDLIEQHAAAPPTSR